MDQKAAAKKKTGRFTIWAEDENGNMFKAKDDHKGKAIDGITEVQRIANKGGYGCVVIDIWARTRV